MNLVDHITYLGSNIISIECDANIGLANAWTDSNRALIIGKSDLTDEIKRDVFQVLEVSILLCERTSWTLTKYID